jgi:hypothetical protein
MNGVRRVVPLTAWLLVTLLLASLCYRTLGAEGAALAVLLLTVLTVRWYVVGGEDPRRS